MGYKEKIKKKLKTLRKGTIDKAIDYAVIMAKSFKKKFDGDDIFRKRFLIISLSVLFILDYAMFSYHTDKNIFDIFPSLPAFSDQKQISIYLPSVESDNLIRESRMAPKFNDNERYVRFLFKTVMKGSIFENTVVLIPSELLVKNVWISGEDSSICAIDIETALFEENARVIKGSEDKFKRAVEKSITENIPNIKTIYFLNSGVYGKKLWEDI